MTFRMRRYYRTIGFVGVLCCLIAIVATIYADLFIPSEKADRPIAAFVTSLAIWLFLAAICLTLLLLQYRYRLCVDPDSIDCVGILRRTQIAIAEVKSVRWHVRPQYGSCVVTSSDSKITIQFTIFKPLERRQLVDYLRQQFRESCQEGWECFFDRHVEWSTKRRQEKQRLWQLIALALLGIAVSFLFAWLAGQGTHFLVVFAANSAIGLYLLCWSPLPGDPQDREEQSI